MNFLGVFVIDFNKSCWFWSYRKARYVCVSIPSISRENWRKLMTTLAPSGPRFVFQDAPVSPAFQSKAIQIYLHRLVHQPGIISEGTNESTFVERLFLFAIFQYITPCYKKKKKCPKKEDPRKGTDFGGVRPSRIECFTRGENITPLTHTHTHTTTLKKRSTRTPSK